MQLTHSLRLAAALALAAAPLGAQSIASRVERAGDGTVRMSFAARAGVCGRGTSISTGGGPRGRNWMNWFNESSRDVTWDVECDEGPVRVVLETRGGEVARIRTYVGGRWREPRENTVDLGTVPAPEAASFLLSLADTASARAGRDAILPATLADGATIWPQLVRLARAEGRPRETRRQAIFWLGQMAGDAVTPTLDDIAGDNSVDHEVREQAVFALSQRPREEGVPALIRIARTSRDRELRKKALFWLGQSEDPRALALFEELLTKK